MEDALGHVTHGQTLQHWVLGDSAIASRWVWVPYYANDVFERVPKLPFSWKLSLRARTALRRERAIQEFDALYFHTQQLMPFNLSIIANIPTIISLDTTPANFDSLAVAYDSTAAVGVSAYFKRLWYRKIFSRAVGLVAFSDWVKASLVHDFGADADRIEVIRSGVDVHRWQPHAKSIVPQRRLKLLFVGGDFYRKGGPLLLKAFRDHLSALCELDIVTNERDITPAERVRVHRGLTPEMPRLTQLFAEADLFVLPTQGDATPFAILEAMACGLPVITTDVGALRELVEHGTTGFLIPRADPQALVDAVTVLAMDRRKLLEMGRAARATVEREFNAESNYQRLVSFIRERAG